jgi:undecaprenyl-diphosphatase
MGDTMAALRAMDVWGFLLINRSLQNPFFDLLMPILSTNPMSILIPNPRVRYALVAAAVVILILGARGARRMWVLLTVGVVAVVLADAGTTLIKSGFQRTRPCHVISHVHLLSGCSGSFALPSNHASNMFAIAAAAWVGLRRWRWPLFILAAAVAYSRIYVGVHYPTDVVVGAFWGAAIGWACAWGAGYTWPGWLHTDRSSSARSP